MRTPTSPHDTPTDEPAPSRPRHRPRQARAQQTVDAVLTAAAELIDERGLDGATTDRIARRAGVSVGSMYQYFANKEAILDALSGRLVADVDAARRAWLCWLEEADPEPEEAMRRFVAWLVEAHGGPRRLRCLLFEERPPVAGLCDAQQATITALAGWLRGRVARPEVSAPMLYRAVTTLVHQFVLHPSPAPTPDEAAEEVVRLATAYLRAAR